MKEKFMKFCESLKSDVDPSYVWRKVKQSKNRFNYLKSLNNDDLLVAEAIYRQIVELFPSHPPYAPVPIPETQGEPTLNLPFSELEFSIAIQNLKLNSSPR